VTRILVYSDCAGMHGAEQVNHSLALGLQAAGHRVSFAQPLASHALIDARERAGISHHWLPPEQLYELGPLAPSLCDAGPAKRIRREARPELVLFADGCPLSSLAAKEYCRQQDIPFVALVHCVFEGWQVEYAMHLPALAQCYAAARQVVAVSEDNLSLLRRCFALRAGKGRVIHNGRPEKFFAPVDAGERARLRGELGLAPDSVLCLGIGRMEWVKGFHYQLEAMRHMVRQPCWPALHFLWVGSGTQQKRLVGLARLLARDRITHFEEHTDIAALMAASDMLVHAAQYEGMPLVILEAMARGLPVVATAVSGVPEALGDTGVLLDAPDAGTGLSQQIADAVCSLAVDNARRARLGMAARQRAQALFTESSMVQHYRELIADVMAHAG
jgi:glycosyltransferase involved in cell wall biosynthesis